MSRPLKFLHLTTFYPPYSFGGDAIYVYRLAHGLGDAGHRVDVVHCEDSYRLLHPDAPSLNFADHPNVMRHGLRSRYGALSPILTQQTGRSYLKRKYISELLQRNQYDVIHYHNVSLLGPQILTMQSDKSQAIKLYTTHEHWLICPTHVLWKYDQRACEKAECFRCSLAAKKPPQLWRYTGFLANASRHVDQFLSPSRFSAKMHADRGFPQPLVCLPHFVDRTDDDWMHPVARPHARPYFLFVGRLELIKGLHTLIDLWRNIRDFDLLIAGTGTQEKALRARSAANPRIRFLGPVSQADLGGLYVHAVASIVPSLTYETFGMVVIESFARKTPVIVRDLGALPEVVEDSNGGFVYRNDEDLMAAIRQLGTAPTLRSELGENGYRAYLTWWSEEAHFKRYFELIQEIAMRKFGQVPWHEQSVCRETEPMHADPSNLSM